MDDQLHSTTAIVDATGTLQAQQYYYPYGANRGGAQSDLTDKRFTGQYHESGLAGVEGLYYYNARWYDPALARFAQADTLVPEPGNPQSLNRYAYVYNNPARYMDPSGHDVGIDPIKYPQSKAPPSWSSWRMESGRWKWASEYDYHKDVWLDQHGLQKAGTGQRLTRWIQSTDILEEQELLWGIGKGKQRGPLGSEGIMRQGPDGTVLVFGNLLLPNASVWTAGEFIFMGSHSLEGLQETEEYIATLNHEYCHILQIRKEGAMRFYLTYALQLQYVHGNNVAARLGLTERTDIWHVSPYEFDVAVPIGDMYREFPGLPNIWQYLP